ncbi:MAG: hypothetical protein CL930_05070 [Deltaproteobacteria bacterium]|nr:hypothetical protein [Deltaproteobacteria bacterium]
MAYFVFVVGLIYSGVWAAGLMFTTKSSGDKNPIIPALGLVAFLGLSGMSAMAAKEAMDNPDRLIPDAYMSLKWSQTVDDLSAMFGNPHDGPPGDTQTLAGMGLIIPGEISSRLPDDAWDADAVSSRLILTVIGEPGRRNQRDTLGAKAENEKNGMAGLQIVLKENTNEVTFTEGQEWTYENGDTAETVAKKIGEAIDAHPSWIAEGSPESSPTKVIINPELEANFGTKGNEMEGWVATGKNTSFKVSYTDSGEPQKFTGGKDSVSLKFWYEQEDVLDGNFSMTDRIVMVGFLDNKLSSVHQSGIDLTAEQIDEVYLASLSPEKKEEVLEKRRVQEEKKAAAIARQEAKAKDDAFLATLSPEALAAEMDKRKKEKEAKEAEAAAKADAEWLAGLAPEVREAELERRAKKAAAEAEMSGSTK